MPRALADSGSIRQLIRFALVGVVNTAIAIAVIFLLMHAGVSYRLSNVGGYALGFISSFLMNRVWTFRSTGDPRREMVLFALVFAVAYGVQFAALIALKELAGLTAGYAQLLAVPVYTLVGFAGNKYLTFRA